MKREIMDIMMSMQLESWRERQSVIHEPTAKPKVYNTSEIYDEPAIHCTVRGIFRYTGVEII